MANLSSSLKFPERVALSIVLIEYRQTDSPTILRYLPTTTVAIIQREDGAQLNHLQIDVAYIHADVFYQPASRPVSQST